MRTFKMESGQWKLWKESAYDDTSKYEKIRDSKLVQIGRKTFLDSRLGNIEVLLGKEVRIDYHWKRSGE